MKEMTVVTWLPRSTGCVTPRDLAGQLRYVIMKACRGGTAARWKRRYAVRLTVPRRGDWRARGAVRAAFESARPTPVDPAITSAEIASELRRGADYIRVSIAFTVMTTDVADALAIVWNAFRSAARDDLVGWEVAAAAAQVQPETPLTGASSHADRRSSARRSTLTNLSAVSFGLLTRPGDIYRSQLARDHNPVRRRRGSRSEGDGVTSALACVGLSVSGEAGLGWLVTSAHWAVRETGVYGGVHVGRWQDDSGASLILGWQSGELLDFIPAYTATSGGLLSDCHLINESVAAAVVDADGHQQTAMAFEAEQYAR